MALNLISYCFLFIWACALTTLVTAYFTVILCIVVRYVYSLNFRASALAHTPIFMCRLCNIVGAHNFQFSSTYSIEFGIYSCDCHDEPHDLGWYNYGTVARLLLNLPKLWNLLIVNENASWDVQIEWDWRYGFLGASIDPTSVYDVVLLLLRPETNLNGTINLNNLTCIMSVSNPSYFIAFYCSLIFWFMHTTI